MSLPRNFPRHEGIVLVTVILLACIVAIVLGAGTAGLVTVRREGRSMIYAARFETMNALLGYLTENCCKGASESCAPAVCRPARASTADCVTDRSIGLDDVLLGHHQRFGLNHQVAVLRVVIERRGPDHEAAAERVVVQHVWWSGFTVMLSASRSSGDVSLAVPRFLRSPRLPALAWIEQHRD